MGRSRRKYKQSRAKVLVGLPKKNPRVLKPSFSVPPKLLHSVSEWDDKGSVIHNYKSFGVVSNPNLLSVRSRTPQMLQTRSLQLPPPPPPPSANSDPIDSSSDLEEDDLRSALGKKRRDGKSAPPQPLTSMQRIHIGRLVNKYGDDYQSMLMDIKLNRSSILLALYRNSAWGIICIKITRTL